LVWRRAFSLVDAAFAPVFRYFNVFDELADFACLTGLERLACWRKILHRRSSVVNAVCPDYEKRLQAFVAARNSELSGLAAVTA